MHRVILCSSPTILLLWTAAQTKPGASLLPPVLFVWPVGGTPPEHAARFDRRRSSAAGAYTADCLMASTRYARARPLPGLSARPLTPGPGAAPCRATPPWPLRRVILCLPRAEGGVAGRPRTATARRSCNPPRRDCRPRARSTAPPPGGGL